jgi:hypothetical protein
VCSRAVSTLVWRAAASCSMVQIGTCKLMFMKGIGAARPRWCQSGHTTIFRGAGAVFEMEPAPAWG